MKMLTKDQLNPVPDDMTGHVMVLRATALGKRWQLPKFQLVKVSGGFGAHAESLGTKVFGRCLGDNEEATWHRCDFIGEAKQEQIDAALADERGASLVDLKAMHYLCMGSDMTYGTGATVDESQENCRRAGGKPIIVYRCHEETQFDGLTLTWPNGAEPATVAWRSASAKKRTAR